LKKLRDEGKTILLVTHKLREVMAFTDRVTVFRAGHVTRETDTCQTNAQDLANMMVGRKVALSVVVPAARARPEPAIQATDLNLEGAAGSRRRLSITFSVKQGEIVGVAGVEGNGQTELVDALLHPREKACRTSGTVKILGEDVSDWRASKIRELGVAVVPEDRLREGLLLERPVSENFLLGRHRSSCFSRAGWVSRGNLRTAVARGLAEYDIRPNDPEILAAKLSGGNQQKLILAREFQREPKVVIAAQPTRGVDVGAIEFIHQRIVQARDAGAGVLLVSSELDEILTLADRILVMYEGRFVGEFRRGEASEEELGLKMGGA
jgi:simple sugar transport system ATP-binding protein